VRLKIPDLKSPTCKDWRPQIRDLKFSFHTTVNGPMISPKRCPTTPTRATCENEFKCLGKMPMLLESKSRHCSRRKNRWCSKPPLPNPWRGNVGGRYWVGVADVHLLFCK
jgi:hypothetical protein